MSTPVSFKTLLVQSDAFGHDLLLIGDRPCVVQSVMPQSTAGISGLRSGDMLMEVNGIDVQNLTLDQVSSLIRSFPLVNLKFSASGSRELPVPGQGQSNHDSPVSSSPLFGGPSTIVQHVRVAVVLFVDKLTLDSQLRLHTDHIVRKLQPLKQKSLSSHEMKFDSVCIFEVFTDCLRIYLPSKSFEYSPCDLGPVGALAEDKRFFYLFTRGRQRSGNMYRTHAGSNVGNAPGSCCLFRCLPPKYLGHRGHSDITNMFSLICRRDRLTGECSEFPRTVHPLVQDLSAMINHPSAAHTVFQTPVQFGRRLPLSTVNNASRSNIHSVHCTIRKPDRFRSISCTTPPIKKPSTVSRTSSSRLFGKLSRAANYLKGRWRRSSVTGSPSDYRNSSLTQSFSLNEEAMSSTTMLLEANSFSEDDVKSTLPEDMDLHFSSLDRTPTCREKPMALQHPSFDETLSDPEALAAFRAFLVSEYSVENLDFWCAVQDWRSQLPSENIVQEAHHLFRTFLDPDSPRAVNVDETAVRLASERLHNPTADTFSEAIDQVYHLMKMDSFPRFLSSAQYRTWIASRQRAILERPGPSCLPFRRSEHSPKTAVHRTRSAYCSSPFAKIPSSNRRQSLIDSPLFDRDSSKK